MSLRLRALMLPAGETWVEELVQNALRVVMGMEVGKP
jgi:hypothetical protein